MKVFISYSHHDAEFLTSLHQHLASLRRQNLLEVWTDREIDAGGVLDREIADAMGEADLFLLLVSASFLNSDYCYEKEFQKALEKQKAGKAIIVPIIVRPCDWEIRDLRQFKALPEDGKPVHSKHWHNADEAFADVARGLRTLIEKRRSKAEKCIPVEHQPPQAQPEFTGRLSDPDLPFARELLALMMQHPNAEEQGLTEILRESPDGPLYRAFIPNTTRKGECLSTKKSVFRPAVEELLQRGWLSRPEGNHAVLVYELNPDARQGDDHER